MTTTDRPLGAPVHDWTPPLLPPRADMEGLYTRLEPLSLAHEAELFDAFSQDASGAMWDYLPDGPFADRNDFRAWLEGLTHSADPMFFAVRGESGRACGFASYLRMAPAAGSIEVGYITFSPSLQRTRSASEAIILMARKAFALGYRRFEWKCNALNAPSRRAAIRYGFSYEGVFRQAAVIKGRNRDTAWFSMIDSERAALEAAWAAWLDPTNFDAEGRQKQRLGALTAPIIANPDPQH